MAVNDSWKRFARENGGSDGNFFVGFNYLTVCRNALEHEADQTAGKVYLGLRSVLQGEQNEFAIEYSWDALPGKQSYIMQASRIMLPGESVVLVTHENISRFEVALQDAQTRFNSFTQSLPDTIYTLDLVNRRVTNFNRDTFLGYSFSELMAPNSLMKYVHPEDAAAVAAFWWRAVRGESPDCIEYRLRNKAGQWEWVDNRETVTASNSDGTPREVMIVLRTITDRKRAEEQIAYHARILENVNDVIIGTDENFCIQYWNAAAERTFGWQAEEVIGKSVTDLLRTTFNEGEREDSVRAIREAGAWKGEVIQFTKENQPVNIDANIMAIYNRTGKITGFVSANRDISKRKQVEDRLFQANRELQSALAREQLLARTDSLTGLFNRRHFFFLAEHEFSIARRYARPVSIIIFDLDHFKLVNDRWGHHVGDEVLKHVSQIARNQVREADILARYGGEEFIVLLPNTSVGEAEYLAERIRTNFMMYRIDAEHTQAGVTVSMGVAEKTAGVESLDHLIRDADRALYNAKAAGRNCVRAYVPDRDEI